MGVASSRSPVTWGQRVTEPVLGADDLASAAVWLDGCEPPCAACDDRAGAPCAIDGSPRDEDRERTHQRHDPRAVFHACLLVGSGLGPCRFRPGARTAMLTPSRIPKPTSVGGLRWVDLVDPGGDAATDMDSIGVPGALDDCERLSRPDPGLAVGSTICLSAGSLPSADPSRNSPLGIRTDPGILLISYSLGSRTSTRTKSRSPFSRSFSQFSSVVTLIVESTAASVASSLSAPQKLS